MLFWTAPADVILTVSTAVAGTDEDFDTYIYAHLGLCADPSAVIGCNDDASGSDLRSEMQLALLAGDNVYIYIDAFGGTGAGEALLSPTWVVGEGAACDPLEIESVCGGGLVCVDLGGGPACEVLTVVDDGEVCDDVTLVCGPFSSCVAGVCEPNVGADCVDDDGCAVGLVCEALVCVEVVEVATGEACNDRTLVCAAGDLCVGGVCATPYEAGIGESCDNTIAFCPLNAVCGGASELCEEAGTCGRPATFEEAGFTPADAETLAFVGDTSTQANTVDPPCGTVGVPDYVIEWTAPADGILDLFMIGTYDTVLYVESGVCGAGVAVDCNDDGTLGVGSSELAVPVTAGTTYFIYADGYDDVGLFQIEATFFVP